MNEVPVASLSDRSFNREARKSKGTHVRAASQQHGFPPLVFADRRVVPGGFQPTSPSRVPVASENVSVSQPTARATDNRRFESGGCFSSSKAR